MASHILFQYNLCSDHFLLLYFSDQGIVSSLGRELKLLAVDFSVAVLVSKQTDVLKKSVNCTLQISPVSILRQFC